MLNLELVCRLALVCACYMAPQTASYTTSFLICECMYIYVKYLVHFY